MSDREQSLISKIILAADHKIRYKGIYAAGVTDAFETALPEVIALIEKIPANDVSGENVKAQLIGDIKSLLQTKVKNAD